MEDNDSTSTDTGSAIARQNPVNLYRSVRDKQEDPCYGDYPIYLACFSTTEAQVCLISM